MSTQGASLSTREHPRDNTERRYLYSVLSRRAGGVSVGINLNPDALCNWACAYCQVDRSEGARSPEPVLLDVLKRELSETLEAIASGAFWSQPPHDSLPEALRSVKDISFSGDGEPTTASCFPEVVDHLLAERGRLDLTSLPLVVLSNASKVERPAVKAALERFVAAGGRVHAKLDAGTEAYFQRVDGTRLPFGRVLRNLGDAARRWPLVIQAMFHAFDGVPPSEAELDAWAGRLADILAGGGRLKLVQVYTVARAPAEPSVGALERAALEAAAARVERLGVPVEVFPAR